MIQLILIVAVLLFLFAAFNRVRRMPPSPQKKIILQYVSLALVVIAILLVISGRLHWIGAIIAAAIPFLKGAFLLILRILPFLQQLPAIKKWKQEQQAYQDQYQQQQYQQQTPPPTNAAMNREEALKILGLNENASNEEVIDAHRKLIQKLHPDRGGNDYLAAQINQAKETLLKNNA